MVGVLNLIAADLGVSIPAVAWATGFLKPPMIEQAVLRAEPGHVTSERSM